MHYINTSDWLTDNNERECIAQEAYRSINNYEENLNNHLNSEVTLIKVRNEIPAHSVNINGLVTHFSSLTAFYTIQCASFTK